MPKETKTELADIVRKEIEEIVKMNKKLEEAKNTKYTKSYEKQLTYRT